MASESIFSVGTRKRNIEKEEEEGEGKKEERTRKSRLLVFLSSLAPWIDRRGMHGVSEHTHLQTDRQTDQLPRTENECVEWKEKKRNPVSQSVSQTHRQPSDLIINPLRKHESTLTAYTYPTDPSTVLEPLHPSIDICR